jgi:hypothetical protein
MIIAENILGGLHHVSGAQDNGRHLRALQPQARGRPFCAPPVPNALNDARGLGRYPMAVMIVGSMIAREPAFELRVAILAPHRIDLLHVRGIDGEFHL